MNNQLPATRDERWRQRRSEVAEALDQRPALSLDARLERLEALLAKRKLVAHATRDGRITDERYEDDASVQLAVLKMIHELRDEFPAKAVRVDSTVRMEQLVAVLQQLPTAQLDALEAGQPALDAAPDPEPPDAG